MPNHKRDIRKRVYMVYVWSFDRFLHWSLTYVVALFYLNVLKSPSRTKFSLCSDLVICPGLQLWMIKKFSWVFLYLVICRCMMIVLVYHYFIIIMIFTKKRQIWRSLWWEILVYNIMIIMKMMIIMVLILVHTQAAYNLGER